MSVLSVAAIICLPRQFQITVVENSDENHLRTAAWAFPAYLGGPLSVVDQTGAAEFVRRCDALVASCGARFRVPVRLRDFAASGVRFHTT